MIPAIMLLVVLFGWMCSKIDRPIKSDLGIYRDEKKYSLGIKNFGSIFQWVVPVLLFVQLFTMTSYFSWGVPYLTTKDYQVMYTALEAIPKDTPVMSEVEDVMLNTGRDPISEPSFFSQLALQGQMDITPVLNMVKTKKIGLIIQEWDINTYWDPPTATFPSWFPSKIAEFYKIGILRSTPEMAAAIRDNYQLEAQSGRIWIYEPKSE